MIRIAVPIVAVALLSACSEPLPVANNVSEVAVNGVEQVPPAEGDMVPQAPVGNAANASEAASTAEKTQGDYLGRWVGVEGMVLTVAAKPDGGVTMVMRWGLDDDMAGTFDGSVTAEGLRFVRNGVAEIAVHTDGDATGLKYLAGKTDCLTVKSGEGYCRA